MKNRPWKSDCRVLAGWLVVVSVLMASDALAGHNPPRPQVSYECDRFALKYYPASDSWECAPGTRVKVSDDTLSRIRQLKLDVDARIRELQSPATKLDVPGRIKIFPIN